MQRMMETVMFAVSIMLTTYVGQNYGAGNFIRIKKGLRQITAVTFLYLVLFSTITFVFRRPIIHVFIGEADEEVMRYVEQYLRWMCPTMFLLSFLHVFRGANTGLGNGTAALISGLSELVARGLFTPLLAPMIGFTAVCATVPLDWDDPLHYKTQEIAFARHCARYSIKRFKRQKQARRRLNPDGVSAFAV